MSGNGSTAVGWRRVLPGFGAILFAAQMNLMFSRTTSFLSDPGTGWHLRAGRLMLEERRWIYVDPFSFVQQGRPWITYEWLGDVVFALVERVAGLGGIVWFGFALFALVPLLLFRWLILNGIPRAAAFVYAVGALLVFQAHVLARPHVFTYIAFGILFLVIGPRIDGAPERRHWVALPLLFAAWANFHGGFVAGLLWLATRLAGLLFDRRIDRRVLYGWAGLLVAAAFATLVNPFGTELHGHIWRLLVFIRTQRHWVEFAPPDFYGPSLLGAVVLSFVFVLLIGLARGALAGLSWEELAPLIVFLFFAFKSQRHVMLLLFVASVPVSRAVLSMLPAASGKLFERWRGFAELEGEARGDRWAALLVLVSTGWLLTSGGSEALRIGERHLSAPAAAFLRDHLDVVRRPITTTTTGGPLVYYFFPDLRISFDDRANFGDAVNTRFLRLFEMRPGWRQTLAEERFDSAVIPPEMPLTQGLALLPDWQEVYRDRVVVIFLRAGRE